MIDTVTKIYLDGEFIAYKITYTGSNIEVSVGEDLNNRHYQEILEWVANGGTIVDNGA
tara:strand:+ start:501 stop:674 length:174 start_codon:yes stop_codon:yes gene_type:complete